MLKKSELKKLSLKELKELEESLEVFILSQKPSGEQYHPEYRKNKDLFAKMLRKTLKLRAALNKFFAGQLSRASSLVNLYKVSADQIEAEFINDPYWDREDNTLTMEIEVSIGEMFDVGAEMMALELGAPITLDHNNLEVMKFLSKYTLKLAKDINTTTKKRITTQIRRSIDLGETRDKMADRINRVINDPKRSTRIAQTESIRTFSSARLDVGRRLGIKRKMWLTTINPCPICQQLNHKEIGIDETFEGIFDGPPAHPNCLVGDTLVAAQGITKSYKRWFNGKIITISVAGKNLKVTPNHPILTNKGWIEAGLLKPGDGIFQLNQWDDIIKNPNNDYTVAMIKKISGSLKMAGHMSTMRVPTTTEDFHGDGMANGKVDIVDTNGFFSRDLAKSTYSGNNFFVYSGNLWRMFLSELRSFYHSIFRHFFAPNSIMGSFGPSEALLHSMPAGSQSIGISHSADTKTESLKSTTKVAVSVSDSLADIKKRLAGQISLVKIDDVSISKFSGHVYNLETINGYYFANSIITHNCKCLIKLVYDPNEGINWENTGTNFDD